MADRERTIRGLEPILGCAKQEKWGAWIDTFEDALALLKEMQEQIDKLLEENASNAEMAEGLKELLKQQEPVHAELEGGGSNWWNVCGECHGWINSSDNYCRHCGRRILWNET